MPKLRHKLERIDIDELFSSPVNRGMLSFLERPPEEEKARLIAKQQVNVSDANRLAPGGELPSGHLEKNSAESSPFVPPCSSVQESATSNHEHLMMHPVGDSPPESNLPVSINLESNCGDNSSTMQIHPLGESPLGGNLPLSPWADLHVADSNDLDTFHPVGDLPPGRIAAAKKRRQYRGIESDRHPEGNLPTGNSSQGTIEPEAERQPNTPAAGLSIPGAIVGRRQKIRRAINVQDGHSSGEQLLYLALWSAATPETSETRLISIGYSGMSTLCKLDKSNCKKNIQGLIEKLAVEVTAPYHSVSSTGTTYRIFSFKEILRRRDTAGLIWVIRTSGVRFVHPEGNLPSRGVGESPPVPVGDLTTGGKSETPTPPVGEIPTQIGKIRKTKKGLPSSSSKDYRQLGTLIRLRMPEFDDDACSILWRKCREMAPDCTTEEIIHCFDLKVRQLFSDRTRNVANPVGLMIWSVPKMFQGNDALYLQQRLAKAAEAAKLAENLAGLNRDREQWQARIDDPATPEDQRRLFRILLEPTD
jgi:hypothetical protein